MGDSSANRVFVGGISWKADETTLKSYFETFGPVIECKIIMDRVTGCSKGYGFVTFEDADTANTVKKQANLYFLGKMMNVGDAYRKAEVASIGPVGSTQSSSYISGPSSSHHLQQQHHQHVSGVQSPVYSSGSGQSPQAMYGSLSPSLSSAPGSSAFGGYMGNSVSAMTSSPLGGRISNSHPNSMSSIHNSAPQGNPGGSPSSLLSPTGMSSPQSYRQHYPQQSAAMAHHQQQQAAYSSGFPASAYDTHGYAAAAAAAAAGYGYYNPYAQQAAYYPAPHGGQYSAYDPALLSAYQGQYQAYYGHGPQQWGQSQQQQRTGQQGAFSQRDEAGGSSSGSGDGRVSGGSVNEQ